MLILTELIETESELYKLNAQITIIEEEKKYLNFLHHYEFEESGLKLKDLKKIVKEKKILYDHKVDQRKYKWTSDETLKKIPLSEMPEYLSKNSDKFAKWLEI